MKIAIIRYNAGNVHSVKSALGRLGIESIITDDPAKLMMADKIIFPGVGQAQTAMDYLIEKKLDKLIPTFKQPFLGICLGLQLMCDFSEEKETECMGVFPVNVQKFPEKLKVPHIGWNNIGKLKSDLFKGIKENSYVYFVHSYYAPASEYCIAETDYILPFSAALQKDNFYATQFHPEKSGVVGAKILENFINLKGEK